jgi:3-oxoacyl-[acyl-carrier-protein] synthase-3
MVLTLKLLGTGYSLPQKIVPNSFFEQTLDTTDEWIVQRTGIRERRHCEDETVLDLGLSAAEAALENAGVSSVDAIIVSTGTHDYHYPPLACRIATGLGYNAPFCFDVGATCSGFVYALDIAAHYLCAGSVETVLIIAAEQLSGFADYTDRTTCILFGDAAGAVVAGRGDKPYTSLLACAADPENSIFCRVGEKTIMNGSGVYKFAVGAASRSINAVLEKAGLTADDIDWFVMHQANVRIIEGIASRCKIPMEKVPVTLDRFANPSSASIPLTISVMREDGRLKPGQRVLLSGFGAGLTYGASILEV